MATSGTTTWNATRDQIVTSSLRKIAALAEGDTPSAEMVSNGVFMLNGILKEAQADGMPLWAIQEMTIPMSSFTNGKVSIGVGQTINQPAPLKVLSAYNRDNSVPTNPIDIPMTVLTHYDYNWLSAKYSMGTAVQFFHEPLNQMSNFYVWPIPDAYSNLHRSVILTYQRPFEDAGVATDTLDFPQYWLLAIVYRLAWVLAPEYGVPPSDRMALGKEADALWTRALSFGTEEGSLFVEPDWSRMTLGTYRR